MAIDRRRLVSRHDPVIRAVDPYAPLSVGNGSFAFTADVTGLQSFPGAYRGGIPLCTMAEWGWHETPAPGERGRYDLSDLTFDLYDTYGRLVGYPTGSRGQEAIYHWLRMNPHKFHLGQIGLVILRPDGAPGSIGDLRAIDQRLELWRGVLTSRFDALGTPVATTVCCHPQRDVLALRVESRLVGEGRLTIRIAFPYGSPEMPAADWESDHRHATVVAAFSNGGDWGVVQREPGGLGGSWTGGSAGRVDGGSRGSAGRPGGDAAGLPGSAGGWAGSVSDKTCAFALDLARVMDETRYFVRIVGGPGTFVRRVGKHAFEIKAACGVEAIECVAGFSPVPHREPLPTFAETLEASERHWERFWSLGGAVDLSDSTDPRAGELERRIVLSQYLTAIQCAGFLPPAETGLTCNSWYGKFHLEMHWWHAAQFALWGREELLERSMWWYRSILEKARETARRQGYQGARWPKMVAYDGRESPSPIGPLLIWQQPHPIYYAELLYRAAPSAVTLERYQEIVWATAEFMASFAVYDKERDRYVLGPPVIPAQENHRPEETLNPTFELEYWVFGLEVANEWRRRLGLDPEPKWAEVAAKMAALPIGDGVYLAHERCPETFARYHYDHPSMLGAFGILPGWRADRDLMRRTLKRVRKEWQHERMWGWDFPMMAMTAARAGEPEVAVDVLLCNSPKNIYLPNGHNRQGDRKDLPLYLPGNGGLLMAVAMMAAGWDGQDGARGRAEAPGFPKNGRWRVKYEGLRPMP